MMKKTYRSVTHPCHNAEADHAVRRVAQHMFHVRQAASSRLFLLEARSMCGTGVRCCCCKRSVADTATLKKSHPNSEYS